MITIHIGDCREVLKGMATESVHMVMTSPPYWGLRDYGVGGQLGLEKTPEEYVEKMVAVFREVRRVLRSDGIMFLNMGDSYAGGGRGGNPEESPYRKQATNRGSVEGITKNPQPIPVGLKPKDLIGMPWMLAFALQADGWWLRSAIVWAKPNPMPESVSGSRWEPHQVKNENKEWIDCPGCDKCRKNDGLILRISAGRPTTSYDFVFLFTKSATYFFDQEAVREPQKESSLERSHYRLGGFQKQEIADKSKVNYINSKTEQATRDKALSDVGRNLRDVWNIPTAPYPEAHFATFPPALCLNPIKAGTSEKGCCPSCGAPWVRVVERKTRNRRDYGSVDKYVDLNNGRAGDVSSKTTGWRPSCECDAGNPIPCTVLDPFAGAGTVGLVADQLGRDAILIELKEEYALMAEKRIRDDSPMFADVRVKRGVKSKGVMP